MIKGPYTSKYPKEPAKIYERFRGRPYFYEEDCIGCTACAQVCPAKAIDVEDKVSSDGAKRALIIHWDICIFCGNCQANCPTTKGIMLSQEFDLAVTENREALRQAIEKELVVCECCGEPIIPYDQFVWVANKLGSLCFSNASLLLFYLKALNLSLQENPRSDVGTGYYPVPTAVNDTQRADRVKILCPSCRRRAVLES